MYVYFILAKGLPRRVKIGKSNNPAKRLADLQIGNHKKLSLLGTIKCKDERTAYEAEKAAHQRFRIDRREGEWFACTPLMFMCVLDYICSAPEGEVTSMVR